MKKVINHKQKQIIIFFLINFILVWAAANAVAQTTFKTTYGGTNNEYVDGITIAADGGYVITGETNSYVNGSKYVFMTKFNTKGDLEWFNLYGSVEWDAGRWVELTADGGFIVVGGTTNTTLGTQVYLIRTDAKGDTLWTKKLPGIANAWGEYVQPTSDGGFIISGRIGSSSTIMLMKTDANGDTLWTKSYPKLYPGSPSTYGNVVKMTPDGGYLIAGYEYNGGLDVEVGRLIKTDSLGNMIWTQIFSGVKYAIYRDVYVLSDTGYLFTGITSTGQYGLKLFMMKTDSYGDTAASKGGWVKIMGPDSGSARGNNIEPTLDGNFVINGFWFESGNLYKDNWLLKFNIKGDTIWTRKFHEDRGSNEGLVKATADGGYVIAADFQLSEDLTRDIILIKTDSLGNTDTLFVALPDKTSTKGISVYPNPFTASTIIRLQKHIQKATFELYDLTGRKIRQLVLNHTETVFPRNNLPPGIYFYRIGDQETIFHSGKLVIH